ncbi:MAG: ATP-binding protein, partial [Actinobacteria bacterium]|nr:ATP-binding protein [Actinomycetota bacterium]
ASKSEALENRIIASLNRPPYAAVAIRIIHALSVQRLAQSDIHAPIGVTSSELRDDLCLQLALPPGNETAEFLKTLIESVLNSIIKTANGQYIALNPGNQQYYLDLKRDIDFETLVSQKAETVGPGKLDEYYYDVLRRTIFEDATVASNPHVRSPQVWQYEVPWKAHGVTRTGYLFFGAPNQRDTASPPRDCYLYFLQPFAPPSFQDARKPDELFVRLAGGDDTFRSVLRLYAGAQEMALASAAGSKSQYEELAKGHLRTLSTWLNENHATAFHGMYRGNLITPPGTTATIGVRERISEIAATSFAAHFTALAPDYPVFRSDITATNRAQAALDAIRWFGGGVKSQLGARVLDGLGLLVGDTLSVDESPYARAIREMMDSRGEGQVINRSELVEEIGGIEYWKRFRLEPEFLAVVVAAMAYTGNAVVNTGNGVNLDATSGALFTQTSLDNMSNFRHIKRPRDFPVGPLRTLFQLIGLNPGMLATTGARESAIASLQSRVQELIGEAVRATSDVSSMTLWGDQVLGTSDATSLRTRLTGAQTFLQSISPLNTVARMTNFPHTSDAINAQRGNLDAIAEVGRLKAFVQHRQPVTQYLLNAEL